jgi:hypothetical protein
MEALGHWDSTGNTLMNRRLGRRLLFADRYIYVR